MTRPDLYNPAPFRVDDPQVLGDCIDALRFATLVSNGADGPRASHLPMLLDGPAAAGGTLRGHLARANGHVETLAEQPVLVMFQGPAYYVSPGWYPSKRDTGRVVPTWNYVVIHVRGRVRLQHQRPWLRQLVTQLTDRLEAGRGSPWAVTDAPDDYIDQLLDHIVGVEIAIEAIDGKFKLGQNRSAADRAGLAAGLAAERPDLHAALKRLPGTPTDL